MSDQPRIVARAAQPYVAVTERVSLDQLADAIDHGFAEVFGWLAVHEGVSAAGAPLIRYAEVDMADSLLIDVAVPVDGTPPPDERVRAGVLPAGDYVTLLFRGHYEGLVAANAAVQQWGEQHGAMGDGQPDCVARADRAISHRPARRTGPDPVGNRDRISRRGPQVRS